ncbi:HD domain-containing protein [Oscillospiraceae bacterium OttesenSCG-928-G22]|nr:HD domain-containing protein [Oscillospiraceae bacterium OttesenSCG-928-G22]
MNDRLERQLRFILEIDKLKTVLRQTVLTDKTRRETDAEHSWHIAVMAPLLREHAVGEAIDVDRVIRMLLVHDLVEIDAGDAFAFDPKANEGKLEREIAAADRLFSLLPGDQAAEFRALWEEFEAEETEDAKYAAAIDCFQPFLHNAVTGGHTWKLGQVCRAQVMRRMAPVKEATPAIWEYLLTVVEDAVKKGYIREDA